MTLPRFYIKEILKEQKQLQQETTQPKQLLRINPPDKYACEGVQLAPQANGILLTSFSLMILGKPGSGKSHLIKQLVTNNSFYGNKFNRIIYIGPTRYEGVIQDNYNTSPSLDIKFINNRISDCQKWADNMLIVFDDVISNMNNQAKLRLQELFFNRRHQLEKGCISIIVSSQKLTSVPTWIRATINGLITFSISKAELKILLNQIPLVANLNQIKKQFQCLQKHEFIFFNLERGAAFDCNFQNIS